MINTDERLKLKQLIDDKLGWECYGSEAPLIAALKLFFAACGQRHSRLLSYDYREVGKALGSEAAAWLIICRLVEADMIEYGTSPRCGWLNGADAHFLKRVFDEHDVETICKVIADEIDREIA